MKHEEHRVLCPVISIQFKILYFMNIFKNTHVKIDLFYAIRSDVPVAMISWPSTQIVVLVTHSLARRPIRDDLVTLYSVGQNNF